MNARPSEWLQFALAGDEVLIARHGKTVAALVSAEELEQLERLRAAGPQAGLAGLAGLGWRLGGLRGAGPDPGGDRADAAYGIQRFYRQLLAYLFDTVAIAELFNPRPAPAFLEGLQGVPRDEQYTSAVVVGELFRGAFRSAAPERHLHNIEQRVLPALSVLPYDSAVARVFGEVQAQLQSTGKPQADADAQIGATADFHGLELVTGNVRHFARLPALRLDPRLDPRDPSVAPDAMLACARGDGWGPVAPPVFKSAQQQSKVCHRVSRRRERSGNWGPDVHRVARGSTWVGVGLVSRGVRRDDAARARLVAPASSRIGQPIRAVDRRC